MVIVLVWALLLGSAAGGGGGSGSGNVAGSGSGSGNVAGSGSGSSRGRKGEICNCGRGAVVVSISGRPICVCAPGTGNAATAHNFCTGKGHRHLLDDDDDDDDAGQAPTNTSSSSSGGRRRSRSVVNGTTATAAEAARRGYPSERSRACCACLPGFQFAPFPTPVGSARCRSCPEGTQPSRFTCLVPPGSYFAAGESRAVTRCPENFFCNGGDILTNGSIKWPCPAGTSTLGVTGAASSSACVANVAPPGFYFNGTANVPCPVNSYCLGGSITGAGKVVNPCPAKSSTNGATGGKNISACIVPPQFQWDGAAVVKCDPAAGVCGWGGPIMQLGAPGPTCFTSPYLNLPVVTTSVPDQVLYDTSVAFTFTNVIADKTLEFSYIAPAGPVRYTLLSQGQAQGNDLCGVPVFDTRGYIRGDASQPFCPAAQPPCVRPSNPGGFCDSEGVVRVPWPASYGPTATVIALAPCDSSDVSFYLFYASSALGRQKKTRQQLRQQQQKQLQAAGLLAGGGGGNSTSGGRRRRRRRRWKQRR